MAANVAASCCGDQCGGLVFADAFRLQERADREELVRLLLVLLRAGLVALEAMDLGQREAVLGRLRRVALLAVHLAQLLPRIDVVGEARYEGEAIGALMALLRWGEVLHVGRHAAFGNGKIAIVLFSPKVTESQHCMQCLRSADIFLPTG